jgi:hypothetical protein
MQVYKVTNEQIETICNPNNLVACWYDDGGDGFAGVEVTPASELLLSNCEIVEV